MICRPTSLRNIIKKNRACQRNNISKRNKDILQALLLHYEKLEEKDIK
jgi:hypothetical protein